MDDLMQTITQQDLTQDNVRPSTKTNATNMTLEARVSRIEGMAASAEEFDRQTKENTNAMLEAQEGLMKFRSEAMREINEGVIAAGQQYLDKVKTVGLMNARLSTVCLAKTLIRRLEDGDEIAAETSQKLLSLLPVAGTKRSREDDDTAEQLLPTPPNDTDAGATKSPTETERPTKRRRSNLVLQTPSKRPSTRSQGLSAASRAMSGVSPSKAVSGELPAPRRTVRTHKPAKRHTDFISWGEVKAAKAAKGRRK